MIKFNQSIKQTRNILNSLNIMKIKVLIVDTDPLTHEVLKNYIKRTPELELIGSSFNLTEAQSIIKTNSIDLMFFEINSPKTAGFDFLKMLKNSPFIIFTATHSKFALESYEYNSIDYLKKPITYERFLKSIDKLIHWIRKDRALGQKKGRIDLKIEGEIHSLPLNQILYIKSFGNYVKVVMENKTILTEITTKELEDKLPKKSFIRIHKSFIINKYKIVALSEQELTIGNAKLPIGKTYKKYVKEFVTTKQ